MTDEAERLRGELAARDATITTLRNELQARIAACETPGCGLTCTTSGCGIAEALAEGQPHASVDAERGAAERAVGAIIQDICELDPDDPTDPDTVCIQVSALEVILRNHLDATSATDAAGES